MRKLGMLALAAGALMTSTAEAGTIRVSNPAVDYYYVEYTAAAGESNRVTATWVAPARTLVLRDRGAKELTAAPDSFIPPSRFCTFVGQVATCVFPQETYGMSLYATLGDGDDTSMTDAYHAHVSGGPGADRLTNAGTANAWLSGEGGDDLLTGGDGYDTLDGGPGADRLDGGAGPDTVGWYEAVGGVHVTLDGVGNDGHDQGAERDNVLNVESVWGTPYADVITGGAGDETIYGHGGDDRIAGGPGRDRIAGDSGDDRIDLRDGEADQYSCDEGIDEALADPFDQPWWSSPACETLTVEDQA